MRDSRYRETWEESADGQILGALINGDLGWLMYLRQSGDAGFSSRNPSYAGPPDAVIEYYLGNVSVTNTQPHGLCRLSTSCTRLSIFASTMLLRHS